MLTWIRKRSGARWVKVLMVILALTFFGGFGLLSSTKVRSCLGMDQQRPGTVYAEVDGIKITQSEFNQALRNQRDRRRQMLQRQNQGRPVSSDMIDDDKLSRDVMDSLIAEKIINREAEELGVKVSDQEVREEIARTPAFTDQQGNFSRQLYHDGLRRIGYSPARFEEMVRQGLRRRRVQQSLTSAVRVLPQEVEEHYAFDNQELKIDYLLFDPAVIASDVKPSDERVKEYFRENPIEFYLGETRRVEYVSWSVEGEMSGFTASPEEVKNYYEEVKNRYMIEPEQVKAAHILIKVSPEAPTSEIEQARQIINEVHRKIEGGADFEEMAMQYSEDATAQQGGDLGWFARRKDAGDQYPAMVEDFEKAAFALNKGGVSEPVRTDFGFHLIKVTDRKEAEYKPLEEIRSELVFDLKHGKAMMEVRQKAEKVEQWVEEGASLEEAGQKVGKEVKTSPWFQSTDDKIFGMEDSRAIVENAFDLEKGKVSGPLEGEDHIYLIKVIETKPEHEASLEEVKPRIVNKLTPEARLDHTKKYAEEQLTRLKDGEVTMEGLAEEEGIRLKSTEFQKRGSLKLPEIESNQEFGEQLLTLTDNNPWPEKPVTMGEMVVLIKLKETRPPDMSGFPQYKATYRQELLRRKQMEVMENWLDKMEEKLVTYTDEWKQYMGEEVAEVPQEKEEGEG